MITTRYLERSKLMPLNKATSGGKPGYRWGQEGKVYTYKPGDAASRLKAKKAALRQGLAITRRSGEKFNP